VQLNAPIGKILAIILAILFLTLGLNLIRDPFIDIVTEAATQTESVTSNYLGVGTLTLDTTHFFSDTEDMTLTGATDGDVTSGATLSTTDRKTITLTGLTGTTTQDIVATYYEDAGGTVDPLWRAFPFFILVGVVAAIMGGGFLTGMSLGNAPLETKILSGIIVVLVGGIMTGVQNSFITATETAFANTPLFTGITLGLPLLNLAYILMLLTVVFGMFGGGSVAGKVKGIFGGD